MSRLGKLKHLKDEVNRLFHEGLNENAVIDQLLTDQQFADAIRGQAQAFYNNLQEESNAKAENERQIAQNDQEIAEIVQAERRFQIDNHTLNLVRKQQKKFELEFLSKHQQYPSKFLLNDDPYDSLPSGYDFWQERFFMTVVANRASNVYTIKVEDLFQGTTKIFTAEGIGQFYDICALKFPFALLHESSHVTKYLRLAKFDFKSESLKIIQSLEFNDMLRSLVNASDDSKFLLHKGNDVNECKLVGDRVQIGKKLVLKSDFNVDRCSYFDKQLWKLDYVVERNDQLMLFKLTQVKMLCYDLEANNYLTYDVDSTPEALDCLCLIPLRDMNFTWLSDTVFLSVRLRILNKCSIIFTNPQMRTWKVVEFGVADLYINLIQSSDDGALMICSEAYDRSHGRKIYKLQIRKPDFLRNMAWTAMVKLFKEAKLEDPYKEAREYLPLNSELNPFMLIEN